MIMILRLCSSFPNKMFTISVSHTDVYATKCVPKKLDEKLTPILPFKAPVFPSKVNLNHSDADYASADDEKSQ